jgi:hypothetical protein
VDDILTVDSLVSGKDRVSLEGEIAVKSYQSPVKEFGDVEDNESAGEGFS